MRNWIRKAIDIQARWVARWLYSRGAFVALVYGTLGWIPLVLFGFDKNGFIYLYIATSLSLITQNPLAMLAHWASRDAQKADEHHRELLDAMYQTMNTMHEVVLAVKGIMEEQSHQIDEIEVALIEEHQAHEEHHRHE